MALGIALGGAVRGLESAERAKLGQDSLALQRDRFEADNAIAQERLAMARQQQALGQAADSRAQLDNLTSQGVQAAKIVLESGGTAEAKQSALRQIFEPIIEVNPDAAQRLQQLEVLAGLPGKSETLGLKDQTSIEGRLRGDFSKMSKEFIGVRDAHNRVRASAENSSPAGDMALLFNFAKVLDPASTVRESEFRALAQAGAFGERVKSQVNRVLTGKGLTDAVRKDFVTRSESLFRTKERQHKKVESQFKNISERMGVDPRNVVLDLGVASNPIEEARAAISKGAPREAVLQRLRENGIDPTGTGL